MQRLHPAVERLVRVHHLLAILVEQLPLLGQAEHLFAALDQQCIEMFFQRADLLAHRRLGDSANTGRAGETATLRQVTKNLETLKKIYTHYESYMQKENLIDFAELILRSYELIRDNPKVKELYGNKFKNILIDEFQDTNEIQFKWIKNLTGTNTTVTAVGDDDQSIYGWRGAKIENINKFSKEKETSTVRLEQNYRSTQKILNAANAVIGKNSNRLGKKLWTEGNEGECIEVYEAYNEQEEANYVAENVHKIFSGGDYYKDIAVLYRSNAQSITIEEYLLRQNLPYVIYGGVRFYERLEIKNVLAYLRLIVNRNDNAAFERSIGAPTRGIGEKTLELIRAYSQENNLSLFHSCKGLVKDGACLLYTSPSPRDS